MDVLTPFYSVKYFAAEILHHGSLPFWNPTYYCGIPLIANPQWGILYPFNWLFFIFPNGSIYTLTQLLHFSIAGIGMFYLIKQLSGGIGGALIGSLIFIFSGYFFAHLAFGAFLFAVSYTPWIFILFEAAIKKHSKKKNLFLILGGGILTGLQLLSGAHQIAFYSLLSIFIFAIFKLLVLSEKQKVYNIILTATLFIVIGLIISSPQIYITLNFFREIERSEGLDYDTVKAGTLSIKTLFYSLVGGTGKPEDAETTMAITYFGLGIFIFSTVYIILRKKMQLLPYFLLGLFSLFLIINIFAKPLYYLFPPYRFFHDPKRARFILLFVISIISGCGWNYFILSSSLKIHKKYRKFYIKLISPIIAFLLSFSLIYFAFHNIDLSFISVDKAFQKIKWKTLGTDNNGILNNRFFSIDPTIHYTYAFRRTDFAQYLLPGVSPYYNLNDFQGYDPSKPERYSIYLSLINSPYRDLHKKHFGIIRNSLSPLISRAGVKYVIGEVEYDRLIFPEQIITDNKPFVIFNDSPFFTDEIKLVGKLIGDAKIPNLNKSVGQMDLYDEKNMLITSLPLKVGREITNVKVMDLINFSSDPRPFIGVQHLIYQAYKSNTKGKYKYIDDYDFSYSLELKSPIKPVYIKINWTDKHFQFFLSKIFLHKVISNTNSEDYINYVKKEEIELSDAIKLTLYEVENPAPIFEIIDDYILVDNLNQAVQILSGNPKAPTIIETSDKTKKYKINSSENNLITDIKYTNNKITLTVEISSQEVFLIHRQSYMKGWKAKIDSDKKTIYPADILFQGIFVPHGKHTITFWFNPFFP